MKHERGSRAGFGNVARLSRKALEPHRPARRIVLFGLFGRGNLGNDASLEAMLELLRRERPDAELLCVCGDPEKVARQYSIPTAPIRWQGSFSHLTRRLGKRLQKLPARAADLREAVRRMRGADVMIIPGTGILDDFADSPGGMPFDLLKWCLAARIAGARIAFVSIGAGPIPNPKSRWLMLRAARLAHYRTYRDEGSRTFMVQAGVDEPPDVVFPDLVHGLTTRGSAPSGAGPLSVGLGVMNYRGWYGHGGAGDVVFDEYVERITRFLDYLLMRGCHVRLLIWDQNDLTAAEEILRRLRGSGKEIADRLSWQLPDTVSDIIDQIASLDVVVASRFHNVICALKLNKPVISIGYADKNDFAMKVVDLERYCQRIETLDVDRLIAQFEALISGRREIEAQIGKANRDLGAALKGQERRLLGRVL